MYNWKTYFTKYNSKDLFVSLQLVGREKDLKSVKTELISTKLTNQIASN